MVLGSWDKVKLICGNHSDDSNEMIIHQGNEGMSTFYSCPCYQSILKKDISGKSCNNRLTIVDYETMLNTLMNEKIDDDGNMVSLKGYAWSRRGVDYKVIKEENGLIIVRMTNKKAILK